LVDFEDLTLARHALTPDAIEIGDQRPDLFGADQRLSFDDIGELVERVMDRGIAAAPTAPPELRTEDSYRQGK
jgi:hypothetical protein